MPVLNDEMGDVTTMLAEVCVGIFFSFSIFQVFVHFALERFSLSSFDVSQ